MKKILMQYTLVLFVAISISTLFLSGCGGNYLPEKYLYKARIEAQKINIKKVNRSLVANALKAYSIVTEKWPLSPMAADAHFEKARLHILTKNTAAALEELEMITINFSKNAELASNAKFNMGQINEREGRIDEATALFTSVYELYPLSKKGLHAPLYIAESLKQHNQHEKALVAYDCAIAYYKEKIAELGPIKISAVIQNYLALTYASQGLWREAVESWEIIIKKYPKSVLVPITYITLGEVYYAKLKETALAEQYFENVLNEYPNTDFALRSFIKLIQVNFFTADYQTCKKWAEALIRYAPTNRELLAQANIVLARCMEKEGMKNDADTLYRKVMEEYADTVTSLRVPLLMASHFQSVDSTDEEKGTVQEIYQKALNEYSSIIEDESKSQILRESAADLTNLIHAKQENWDAIISNMNDALKDSTSTSEKKVRALLALGSLYEQKINNKPEALSYYKEFLTTYPNHPLHASVQKIVDTLE